MKSEIEDIAARFPEPVTLYPWRKKWLFVFLGSALFAGIGFWMVTQGQKHGWLLSIVFSAFAAVAGTMLLPGAGSLSLNADGFVTISLFRRRHALWQDATAFHIVRIPPSGQRMVVYDDRTAQGVVAKLNAAVAGYAAGLPDTYGISADELAALMTRWRSRALAQVR